MVLNAIACTYAAVSLVLSLANHGGKRSSSSSIGLVLFSLDMITVALLFSGIGAAAAIGLVGYKGNTHVKWNKVCNTFGKFCGQATATIVLSALGSIAYLLLAMLSAMGLYKKINMQNY